jgi:hypothetical protein
MITAQKSPVYISKHLNGKMEDMHAISTNTLTNFYCNKMHKEDIRVSLPSLCDKIFNNVDKDKYIDEQNCTGRKCIECLTCYTDSPINVIVEGVK